MSAAHDPNSGYISQVCVRARARACVRAYLRACTDSVFVPCRSVGSEIPTFHVAIQHTSTIYLLESIDTRKQ